MPETPITPGNRAPSIEKAQEAIQQPLSPVNPIVDPGMPVVPGDAAIVEPDPSRAAAPNSPGR